MLINSTEYLKTVEEIKQEIRAAQYRAADIRREFPGSRGYSVRNLKYMAKFAQAYPDREFVQTVFAQICA